MSHPSSANDPGVPVDGLPGGPYYKGSQGYSDYVSPLDYNSYYDDAQGGAPYDVKAMNADAARRRGDPQTPDDVYDQVAADKSNMGQMYAPQPGNFVPDAPLDASQVSDWRNQFGPRAPIQPGSYGFPQP